MNKIQYFTSITFALNLILAQNPIWPTNAPRMISSNFGEFREDHFHMGIDIKTFGKTGYPVYASENGYIERIRVSESGYGKAIYIKHLDGKKTVYAHLKSFAKNIKPNKKIKQGSIIGYVGSTGMSTGPHLHYEVHVNGKKINSQKLKLPSGKTLKGVERKLFEVERIKTDILLADIISNKK